MKNQCLITLTKDEDLHDPDYDGEDQEDLKLVRIKSRGKKKNRRPKSLAWQFYERTDDGVTYLCKFCGAPIKSTYGTTTAMLNHVKKQHPKAYREGVELQNRAPEPTELDDEIKEKPKRGIIWKYFNSHDDDGTATCRTCGESVAAKVGKTMPLTAHLKKQHPDLHLLVKSTWKDQQLKVARQKLLRAVPTDVLESNEVFQEMSAAAVKSSPVWTIFKAVEGSGQVSNDKTSFFFVTNKEANQLECLSLASISKPGLIFVRWPEAIFLVVCDSSMNEL
jgi:BED zinc finger